MKVDTLSFAILMLIKRTSFILGYGSPNHAPGINAHGIGEYLCVHNVLKSHAVAYHLYKHKYYSQFKGQVGIAFDSLFFYSDSNDTITVDRAMQFSVSSCKLLFNQRKKKQVTIIFCVRISWAGLLIPYSAP